ncbi:MAG TPA: beta-N-acetylhexosaminidase [Saprospiraceae bacterium]|mgnify:FL=1|nr:beta-N-acetylhexosaminidase [Saprospiraceae bacterium]
MNRLIILLVIQLIGVLTIRGQYAIIPKPTQLTYGAGELKVSKHVRIHLFDDHFKSEAHYLTQALESRSYTVDKNAVYKPKKHKDFVISLKKTSVENADEAYEIQVNEDGISISANKPVGVFRGIATALQMIPVNPKAVLKMPFCSIKDEPAFEWRGLMLDVSRHFFSVDDVKKFIDRMALYKLSVFHWHLTDDEGWRIEIKAYPQLTAKGAWRVERTGKFGSRPAPRPEEPTPYGGFYTQEQIREVVRYAAERHITVVPEIDVPGHSMALLTAFPELSTKKEAKMVSCGFKFAEWYGNGTFKMLVENMVNPSDERVYQVLDTIFGEVASLFPGKYIHAGGDECYHGFWKESQECQQFMQKNGLKNEEELQSYFMKRINSIIQSKRKNMIGWDEILYGGLAEGAAVMSWRGTKGGIEAASKGHKVVMSPTTHAYLDYTQGDHGLEFPIYANLSLKKSYELDIVPAGVNRQYIMGGQGNLWTEHIPTLSHAFYMAYPRAMALSECFWTKQEDKNWVDFTSRLDTHFSRFEAEDISICKSLYDPFVEVSKKEGSHLISIKTEYPEGEVHYTFDNTFPHTSSPIATSASVVLPEGEIILRAAVFKNKKQLGRTLSLSRESLLKRAK